MLKQFWKEKRHLIQISGILTGVGALFLSIPVPANETAYTALLHLQFIWLVIISIAAVSLMFQLWILLSAFEKEIKKKHGINLEETLSLIMIAGICYFVINLWQYGASLYNDSFFQFFGIASIGTGAFLGGIGYYFWKWVVLKFEHVSSKPKFFISLSAFLPGCLILGAWVSFVGHKGAFPVTEWLKLSGGLYAALLLLLFVTDFYKKHNQ